MTAAAIKSTARHRMGAHGSVLMEFELLNAWNKQKDVSK